MLAVYTLGQATTGPAPAITIEGETAVITQMADRLNAAILGGWGPYPIVPQAISLPEERLINAGGESSKVIVWPEDEYNRWVSAWDYLAGRVLQRLGSRRAFPLGDGMIAKKLYSYTTQPLGPLSTSSLLSLKEFPTIAKGNDAAVDLVVELKRGQTPTEKPRKGTLLSGSALVGLLLAAVAGGSIIYYLRRKDKRAAASPTELAPAAPID